MSLTRSTDLLSRSVPSDLTLKRLVLVQLVLLAGVVITETTQFAYLNHDTIIYTLVGEGIYDRGLLPYDYVFDHKPVLLYFVYGPLAFLGGMFGHYALLTCLSVVALAAIVRGVFTGGRWSVAVLILAMAAATIENVGYSGNSEVVIVPLQVLAVGLLLTSAGRPWRFWGAALATVIAVNANYAAAIPLLVALLYCVWVRTDGRVWAFCRDAIGYGLACLALMAVLFGLLAAAGMDVAGYFQMQATFLEGYSGYAPPSVSGLVTFASQLGPFLALALLPAVPGLRPDRRDLPAVIALECLILGALVVYGLSGKYFDHYVFLVAVPSVIVFLLLRAESRIHRIMRAGLLVLVSLYYVIDIGSGWTNPYTDGIDQAYTPLADTVAGREVLPMRSSVVPFYYSDASPAWPFVWHDHVAIVHGLEAEDDVYAAAIAEGPPFVMTADGWCEREGADWRACDSLRAGYDQILSQAYSSGVPGYTLWRARTGTATGQANPAEPDATASDG